MTKALAGDDPAGIDVREEERLIAVEDSGIADGTRDAVLDKLVELLALSCQRPMAALALVERDQTVIKASYGFELDGVPNALSFSHKIVSAQEDYLVVPDARADARFAGHPLVAGAAQARFAAGVALTGAEGQRIGVLGVMDTQPGQISEREMSLLRSFAQTAVAQIAAIRTRGELLRHLHLEKEVYNRLIRSTMQLANVAPTFDEALGALIANLDPELGWLSVRMRNMQTGGTTGIRHNPRNPLDAEVSAAWKAIDSSPGRPMGETADTQFISAAPMRPEFSYLRVPVHVRGGLIAVLEFLYPNHIKTDPRIRQVYALMASNLSLVAERELVNLELLRTATHDRLTDAVTSPVFLKSVEGAIREMDTAEPDAALLYVDFGKLSEINAGFGHVMGDQLLGEMGRRLKWICRDRDVLGRFGGAEFGLLVRGLDAHRTLNDVIEQLRAALVPPVGLGDLQTELAANIGAVHIDHPELRAEEYVTRAEDAMSLVRAGEQPNFCIATDEIVRRFQVRRNLDRQFREGVKAGRFMLNYQPIMDLKTGRVAGAEALLRLVGADGSLVPAGNFLSSLRGSRFVPELDDWVFDEAVFAWQKHAPELPHDGFYLSINVSPVRLATKGYPERCLQRLAAGGLPATALTLEILESELDGNEPVLLSNLQELHEAGVRIAVDDFGTGFSNLQHLALLPVDAIKIDRVFLRGISRGENVTNALLAAINSIGKELGYRVIAEGVETAAQAEYLTNLGCGYAQGFYYAKPMPWNNLMSMVHETNA